MWIQRLHSCGLLNSSFLPDDQTESVRSLVRFRRSLTQDSRRYIQRMQKALEQINIKVHTVISDLTGKTGTAMIEDIIEGKTDSQKLISHVDCRIKADKETLLKSLEGNWRKEHLITLKQSYKMHKFIQEQISDLEKEIEKALQHYVASKNEGVIEEVEEAEKKNCKNELKKKPKKKTKNKPAFNTRAYLKQLHKVNVIDIFV